MPKTEDGNYGYVCAEDGCGSVKWIMRKDNRLECSKCQSVIENVAWVNTPVAFTARYTDSDGVEKTKVGELICDGVEREVQL